MITTREMRNPRPSMSVEQHHGSVAGGLEAMQCAGGDDEHPARFHRERLPVHRHRDLSPSHDQSLGLLVTLAGVFVLVQFQQLHSIPPNDLYTATTLTKTCDSACATAS